MAKTVFYSFHYAHDVHRVQLVRNINALEGQPLLNSQDWEQVRRKGEQAIKNWIHAEMARKKAVIVLIGRETVNRPWVIYEIEKAWNDKKPLLGVRIHGLASLNNGANGPGPNPFDKAEGPSGVPVFDPTVQDGRGNIDTKATYNSLVRQLEGWSSQGVVRLR